MGLRLNFFFVCCHETSSSQHCMEFLFRVVVTWDRRRQMWRRRTMYLFFCTRVKRGPSICTVGIPQYNVYTDCIDTISLRLFLFNLIVFDLFSAHVFFSRFFSLLHARTHARRHIYMYFHVFPYIILSS